MKEMKFAKCMYARFANSEWPFKLVKGEVFAVTDDIAESQVFLDGINTKNFIMVEVRTRPELNAVVNLSDAMVEEFEDMLAEKDEAELAQAEAEATPEQPPAEDPDEESGEDDAGTQEEEDAKAPVDEGAEDQAPAEDEQTPSPDIEGMGYKDLQTFALELEKKYEVELNRSAKKADLLKEIKDVLAKHTSD
jgi:hypothetical protein